MKRIKDEELRIDLYTFTYSSFLILHFYSSFFSVFTWASSALSGSML